MENGYHKTTHHAETVLRFLPSSRPAYPSFHPLNMKSQSRRKALASRDQISAIHSLPNSVLSQIFHLCEPRRSDPDSDIYDSLHTNDFPWVLSYVCRRWRIIVLASPRLWTTVQLNIDRYLSSPYPTTNGILPLLDLSLKRSRNIDIHVEINDFVEREEDEQGRQLFIDTLIPLLLSTASRWCDLKIDAYPDLLETVSGRRIEHLRSLEIFLYEDMDESSLTLFQNAPKLTALRLESLDLLATGGIRSMKLPWSRIQNLTIPVDGLIRLPLVPRLEQLHVYCGFDDLEEMDHLASELHDLSPFVLPVLSKITLQDVPTGRLIHKLSTHLSTPALQTLNLYLRVRDDARLPVFQLDRLTNLSIDLTARGSDDMVIAFLSRTVSVTTLSLGRNAATPAVMDAIGRGVLLPNLGVLCLQLSVMAAGVVSMLERRGRTASPITQVKFAKFSRDWWARTYSCVEDLMKGKGVRKRWGLLSKRIDIQYIDLL